MTDNIILWRRLCVMRYTDLRPRQFLGSLIPQPGGMIQKRSQVGKRKKKTTHATNH